MDPLSLKSFSDHLLSGALAAAAGSAAGIWLPLGAGLMLLGLALCRICWIEDNIHQDLLPAERLPPGYRHRHGTPPGEACPQRLASQLRVQAHAWAAFSWALAAGVLLPLGAPLTIAAGLVALALALRHADYFGITGAQVATGRPLSRRLIAAHGPLTHFVVIPRRPD